MLGYVFLCVALAVAAASAQRPCDVDPGKSLPFCDTKLSMDARVKDLVGRLTVQEKQSIIINGAGAIQRLHIPSYQWWNEALHGIGYSPGVNFGGAVPYATSFPQVTTTAASFNRTLFNLIAQTIATEARAFSNNKHAGLTYWTPNINIYRDPRWGRGQETPGEDPFLSSEYAANFVRGMQEGEDPRYVKASSCCKHYTAYDFEGSGSLSRHNFNAIVTDQDMTDTFMPPFQACVEKGKASSLMCAYNSVNGVPACADGNIMNKLARQTWGFQGYITSDCAAVNDVIYNHHYTNTSDQTCAAVLGAGMDIECGSYLKDSNHIVHAVQTGELKQDVLDTSITNLFLVQYRLGMFDPEADQPYMHITASEVNTAEAKQLALEAAEQGMVLLKNSGSILPLSSSAIKNIAVIGPNADAAQTMLGNYNGKPEKIVTVLGGVQSFVSKPKYVQGCDIHCTTSDFQKAVEAASTADATIIVVGIDGSIEGEDRDRKAIGLPGNQGKLITTVAAASRGPVVVVVIAGGIVDFGVAAKDPNVDAIIWAGYCGQSGGQAVANAIFGKINPAGRLPFTIYPESYISVPMTDMNMRPSADKKNPGRTYRFYTGTPIYKFGDGLSYTTFEYTTSKGFKAASSMLQDAIAPNSYLRDDSKAVGDIQITVRNNGTRSGGDIVLAYIVPPHPGVDGAPLKTLIGFERVFLGPGESVKLTFPVTAHDLSLVNSQGLRTVARGVWSLQVGSKSVPILVN